MDETTSLSARVAAIEHLLGRWWQLSRVKGIGRQSLYSLREQLGGLAPLANASDAELQAMGLAPDALATLQQPLDHGDFHALLEWPDGFHKGIMGSDCSSYPEALASLPDAPLWMNWYGNPQVLKQPMVALVGSRNPTPYAREWTWQCAHDLAKAGVCVVSGLALGIDGAAHDGALAAGGSTVAVLGCGIDVVYPKRHRRLYQRIAESGLILSELPPGTAPLPAFFPGRNRIVSGLSQIVVVAEAAEKSGSLITARLAASQGRDVMALPGAVTNPLAAGCHQLLRDGATLVRDAGDVLEELGLFNLTSPSANSELAADSTPASEPAQVPALVQQLDFANTTSLDVLAIRTGAAVSVLLAELLELELDGWLRQEAGGYRRLR